MDAGFQSGQCGLPLRYLVMYVYVDERSRRFQDRLVVARSEDNTLLGFIKLYLLRKLTDIDECSTTYYGKMALYLRVLPCRLSANSAIITKHAYWYAYY